MLTDFTLSLINQSVLAVPPLALNKNLEPDAKANAALVKHIEDGGVRALIYGGNANVQNWPVSSYADWLDQLEAIVAENSWLIPSVGPDYGKLMDEATILKTRHFPAAMALPLSTPQTPEGVLTGLERFVDRSGVPLVVYIKKEGYISADNLARLVEQEAVLGVKYAVPRQDSAVDMYLTQLIDAIGNERIVSGLGEPAAVSHLEDFGVRSFTSGCVCIAPFLSLCLLEALSAGDGMKARQLLRYFEPLETLREHHHPVRVLHTAVTLSGIADMGPLLPLMTEADSALHADIGSAARILLDAEMKARNNLVV
ncbi:MAG: dihydrodipicolinate synthase family protein [Pseudomonadota bacterium]